MLSWRSLFRLRSRPRGDTGEVPDQAELELRMRDVLSERLGGPPEAWSFHPVYAKPVAWGHDRVIRAEAVHGTRVAIKVNAFHTYNARHFEALAEMHAAMPEVVAPLCIDPEGAFFVMEWIDAPLLSSHLEAEGRLEAIARAGAWLARLHKATDRGTGTDERLRAPKLPFAPGEGNVAGDPVAEASAQLHDRFAALDSVDGPMAMLHNDFQLHNLFDLGDRVLAFDRPGLRKGLVEFDLARCRIGLRLYRDLAAEAGRASPGDDAQDRRALASVYGRAAAAPLAAFVEDLVLFRLWNHFRTRAEVSEMGPERNRETSLRARLLRGQLKERGLLTG